MTEAHETAGVIAPPPLIALGAVLAGLALDWLLPAYVLTILLDRSERIVIGVVLIAVGAVVGFPAVRAFHSAGTNIEPWKPSTVLTTTGVYAHVRNPMYVGLGFLVAGTGIVLASDWTLVMLVAAALTMHFGVIKREERYLTAKFGEPYLRYLAAVPRYGIRIR